MSDWETQEEETEETSVETQVVQPQATQAADHDWQKEKRQLLKELSQERKRRQEVEFKGLKEKYPTLEPEDVEGISPSRLEALLAKVGPLQPPAGEQPEQGQAPSPEEVQAAQSFTRSAGGQGPAHEKPIPFAEAKQKLTDGTLSWGQIQEMVKKGLIDGVKAPR